MLAVPGATAKTASATSTRLPMWRVRLAWWNRSLNCVAAGTFASLALAGGASASALSAFHTPEWSVQCYVVGEETPATLTCSIPQSGFFVSMNRGGRPRTGLNALDEHHHDPFAARRLLGFDRYWAFGSLFGCVSRSTGLTCWNSTGHGWRLARSGAYRLF
jgi:hypothetical protein